MATPRTPRTSKHQHRAAERFKNILENLGCPYTDGVDESWIKELIFSPGEARIQLLQWLFTRMDIKLQEYLEPSHALTDPRIDGRISRLLQISCAMGFCTEEEVDVIHGTCSRDRQMRFMELVLDTVSTIDAASDSPAGVFTMEQQFKKDSDLLDVIVSTQSMSSMLPENINLLPPDINEVIRDRLKISDSNPLHSRLPNVAGLLNELDTAGDRLHHQKLQHKKLSQQLESGSACGSSAAVSRQLKLTLSENSQLLKAFCACVDAELRHWCRRGHDRSSEYSLVPGSVERLLEMMKKYNKLLCDISQTLSSHTAVIGDEHTHKLQSLRVQSSESIINSGNIEILKSATHNIVESSSSS